MLVAYQNLAGTTPSVKQKPQPKTAKAPMAKKVVEAVKKAVVKKAGAKKAPAKKAAATKTTSK